MFFTEGPTQDALVNEIQTNEWAMHDPYDIAHKFISFEEDQTGKYYDKDSDSYIAYDDPVRPGVATVGPGLTGLVGGNPIVAGQNYPSSTIAPEFKKRLETDYKRLDRALDGAFSGQMFNPNQQASIMSLLYNVGYGNLKGTKAFDALKSGDLDTFKEEAFGPTGFNKSKGEFVQGLQNRRDAERALFDTPIR